MPAILHQMADPGTSGGQRPTKTTGSETLRADEPLATPWLHLVLQQRMCAASPDFLDYSLKSPIV